MTHIEETEDFCAIHILREMNFSKRPCLAGMKIDFFWNFATFSSLLFPKKIKIQSHQNYGFTETQFGKFCDLLSHIFVKVTFLLKEITTKESIWRNIFLMSECEKTRNSLSYQRNILSNQLVSNLFLVIKTIAFTKFLPKMRKNHFYLRKIAKLISRKFILSNKEMWFITFTFFFRWPLFT